MPKLVDHVARRAQISAATWRVIQRGGLQAVTLRSVAQEARVSLGVLAHYFDSKEDILLDAHRMAFDHAIDRAVKKTRGLVGLAALREALLQALPIDAERRLEAQVDAAFIGMAITHPALRATRRESAEALRRLIFGCIADARAHHQVPADIDDVRTADECLSLIDGASILGLLESDAPDIVERLVGLTDAFVQRLAAASS